MFKSLYKYRIQNQALLNSCALLCLIAWHTDPQITAVTWSAGTVQIKSVQSPRADPEKPSPKTLFKGSFQTALSSLSPSIQSFHPRSLCLFFMVARCGVTLECYSFTATPSSEGTAAGGQRRPLWVFVTFSDGSSSCYSCFDSDLTISSLSCNTATRNTEIRSRET